MSTSQDESSPSVGNAIGEGNGNGATRGRRERSNRYPGVPLAESVELARFVESKGLDGLSAADIATALGYKNIKTNTFSAKLSAARQFGLLSLKDEGYWLTPLAKSILHPLDPAELPRFYRQALLEPPLYAELAERLTGKRVPDVAILGNVLYHHHQIIATAKQAAAEAFLTSAKFAGALGEDLIFLPQGAEPITRPRVEPTATPSTSSVSASVNSTSEARSEPRERASAGARIDLRLWGDDEGKIIRVRAPATITKASFDRLIQALQLHVRIEDSPSPEA